MKTQDLQQLRDEYSKHSLDENEVDLNPLNQFDSWFEEALDAKIPGPNAMHVATVDSEGKPHVRVILLKGYDKEGFVFYTNLASDKGKEIDSNPNVSLCFFWMELERQVRIDGTATKLPRAVSEEYFRERPYKSQIGALASDQSKVVPNRQFLEDRFNELEEKYPEGEVPMPESWGGYLVKPTAFEFWQGRRSRLHDRVKYELEDSNWSIKRLSP